MQYRDALDCLDELSQGSESTANAFQILDAHGFGDGLPVGELNDKTTASFVEASGLSADAVVATVHPLRGSLTVRRLAAAAALAGCVPEHMPLLVALGQALEAPKLNALGVLSTTSSAAFMVVVNGPARHDLRFNWSGNCLGPGNRSNATVGRCLSLVTRMVGGAREGFADMATQGQPAKYTFCFAENEEASPWPPLHIERGAAAGQSAVTVIGVAGIVEAFESDSYQPDHMVASLAPVLAHASPVVRPGSGLIGGGHQCVVVSPEWAGAFSRAGLSKHDVQQALLDAARPDDERLRIAAKPEDLMVVVAGGPGVKQNVVAGWAGGSAPVTRSF
jgi:hypothetical protein